MKKISLMFLLIFICTSFTSAQMPPAVDFQFVFDPISFAETATQTYQIIQSNLNELEEIQKLYDISQKQIESLQSLDPESYEDITDYIDNQISGVDDIYRRLEDLSFQIGEENYQLKEILPDHNDQVELYIELYQAMDRQDFDRAREIREKIFQNDKAGRQYLSKIRQEALAVFEQKDDFIEDSNKRIKDLKDKIVGNESIISQLEVGNLLMIETHFMLRQLVLSSGQLTKMYALESQTKSLEDLGLNRKLGLKTEMSKDFYDYYNNMDDKTFNPVTIFGIE